MSGWSQTEVVSSREWNGLITVAFDTILNAVVNSANMWVYTTCY